MVKRRGKALYIYFKPFKDKKIGVRVDVNTVSEAKQIEGVVLRACRTGSYHGLDPISREVCIRMFNNQQWELPPELDDSVTQKPTGVLTLWKAGQLFKKYPEIEEDPYRWRSEIALAHLGEKLGTETPLKSIWVPDLRRYRIARQKEDGAAPDTVNKEISTLSRLYGVMIEMKLIEPDKNPCRLLKRLSRKSGERQVYLSRQYVEDIASKTPLWFRPMLWTAYYTGARRGEILDLNRSQVDLSNRIMILSPPETKEESWKRVPIHLELVPILQEVLDGPILMSGKMFYLRDEKGVRDVELESFKNCWPRACEALGLAPPWPTINDLRGTWRSNARRSGMRYDIEMNIMGHSSRMKSVHERYGRISSEELVEAIDKMTFDNGKTEILVYRRSKKPTSGKKGNKRETNVLEKRKGHAVT